MITAHDRPTAGLERARWKVKFRESLLEAHRMTTKNGEEWFLAEDDLKQWVEEARFLLLRLERAGL